VTEPVPLDTANELTVLAWRRTLMRWALVAIVGARIFTETFGVVVVIVAFVTIAGALVLNFAASRQYSTIRTGSGLPTPWMPSALTRPLFRIGVTTVATLVVGLAALAWLWLG
jgi:hypothetical protein